VALGMTLGVLAVSTTAGYALARLDFPFKRAVMVLLPRWADGAEQAVFIPLYTMFADLRLAQQLSRADPAAHGGADRRVPDDAVLPAIPNDIEEAARIDGVGWLQIFWLHHAAAGTARDDDAGDPDIPLRLERLSLAAGLGAKPERFTITLGLASDPVELRAIGRAWPRHGLGRHRLASGRDPVPDLPTLRGPGHDVGGSKG
jgi:hypothetical protein